MSTRHRPPVLAATAFAAVLLVAGCSSSGTVGSHGGSSKGSSGGFTGGTGGDSDNSSDLITGSDPGCAVALTAIQNATKLQSAGDPTSALTGIQTAISQLHSAAGKTRKPDAKQAIDKVADDLGTILDQAKSGKVPDTDQALTDASAVATACAG
ncbi:MAG: hypothetical protein ACJ786_13840 [Catenulispora sp.]